MLTNPRRFDHAWIEAHIPHKGRMCLLDEVLGWSADSVRCLCRSHRRPDNPMRSRGRLAAVCGIEIAAQAIAVHGALRAAGPKSEGRTGYLAGVRGVSLRTAWLDDWPEDLIATADRISGNDSTILYDFDLSAGSRSLLGGRAMIIFDPGAAAGMRS